MHSRPLTVIGLGFSLVMFVGSLTIFIPSESWASQVDCASEATWQRLGNSLIAAKRDVNLEHNDALAKREAEDTERDAMVCVKQGVDADFYHYIHATAASLDAMARLATNDSRGFAIFKSAMAEGDAIANDPRADPDVREMAQQFAKMAHSEWKQIQTMHYGQLIIPPTP